MTVRITWPYGVGDWAHGAVLELPEDRAMRLIRVGYAEEVKPKPKKAKES